MKSFEQFTDSLLEAFTSPSKLKYYENDKASVRARSTIDSTLYQFELIKYPDYKDISKYKFVWDFVFADISSGHDEYSLTGNKGHNTSLNVMATTMDFLKTAVKSQDVEAFEFSANNKEPSRVKLYRTMSRVISKKYGFTVTEFQKVGATIFLLEKK